MGEDVTAGFMGRTELHRNKATGWEIQKAAVSTKSFSVVFCRVHSNFSDWTIHRQKGLWTAVNRSSRSNRGSQSIRFVKSVHDQSVTHPCMSKQPLLACVSRVYSSFSCLRCAFCSLIQQHSLILRLLHFKLVFCLLFKKKKSDCHSAGRTAGLSAVFSKEKAISVLRLLIPFYFLQRKTYLCRCTHWNKYLKR